MDTALGPALRADYLAEVRSWLPAFLGAASSEREDPLESVTDLLALPAYDLKRVLAVHVLLHPDVRALADALPRGLRGPATGSHRPRVRSRAISGGVDWAATVRARATGGPLDVEFVTRPAARLFDVPQNRVLAWTVGRLVQLAGLAPRAGPSEETAGWEPGVRHVAREAAAARRVAWLRTLPDVRPSAADFASLAHSRNGFYASTLQKAVTAIRAYTERPTPDDVSELLTQRWFEPSRDWQLFELTVLLRLERALGEAYTRSHIRRIDNTRGPFATFQTDGLVIRLWYQRWPPASAASEQRDAAERYSIAGKGSRPDIVMEMVRGGSSSGLLLELKATRSGEYLSAGLLQLLGYLRDRPELFGGRPATEWLVAPDGPAMTSRDAEERQLWAVHAGQVAAAAVAAVKALTEETSG